MEKKTQASQPSWADSSGRNESKPSFQTMPTSSPAPIAPTAPSTVLPGLTAGASLRRPYLRPTK